VGKKKKILIDESHLFASGVTSGLFTVKLNLYKRRKTNLAFPFQITRSVVTGSTSFRMGSVFMWPPYYSIETLGEES